MVACPDFPLRVDNTSRDCELWLLTPVLALDPFAVVASDDLAPGSVKTLEDVLPRPPDTEVVGFSDPTTRTADFFLYIIHAAFSVGKPV